MISNFVVVSSDLRPYMSWTLGPGRPKAYCEGLLGTSGRALCQGGLQLPPPEELLTDSEGGWTDIESEWTMFSASIVDADSSKMWTQGLWWWTRTGSKGCRQAEEGVLSDHVGLWDSWTQLTGTGRTKQAAALGRSWRQKLGSGRSSVRPWRRTIGRPSKRFWQTVRRLRRGKQYSANTVYSVQVGSC
ncbi:hypothetical protein L3Q82_017829 [Scortum barcoo]|uniref:Uncharacterized protein n=1 Tax=Scortum barcoo TaxID=214431 RepID=A0ACB8VLZ0_9TELE|nr:hypothetical protein L3Q82_017829 [Scortum barcoo]